MARPNPMVQLRNIKDALRHYGYSYPQSIIEDKDSNGNPCIRFIINAAAWSGTAGQETMTAIVRAVSNPNSMFPVAALTPSVDGSVSNGVFTFDIFLEDMGAVTSSTSVLIKSVIKFQADLVHILRGNMQNSVTAYLTAKGTEPKVSGFNGGVPADENNWIPMGTLLPGGRVAVPGYLS